MIEIEGTKSQIYVKQLTLPAKNEASVDVRIYGVIDEESSGPRVCTLVEIDATSVWGHSGNNAGSRHRVKRAELKDAKIARSMGRRLVKLGLAVER